ncbi:unnamed protein product [Peronospora belbahrii]|uniref:Uncharacterized protein n=1 Tax=Peronospora belbahrii TaxID=622444 RepID=A0AAU9L7V7_9STRA|nr:unnamed protein product [Peronospora belbahrii]CAH0521082.1 unnamed protein product [Peronospora belbahrii]
MIQINSVNALSGDITLEPQQFLAQFVSCELSVSSYAYCITLARFKYAESTNVSNSVRFKNKNAGQGDQTSKRWKGANLIIKVI